MCEMLKIILPKFNFIQYLYNTELNNFMWIKINFLSFLHASLFRILSTFPGKIEWNVHEIGVEIHDLYFSPLDILKANEIFACYMFDVFL